MTGVRIAASLRHIRLRKRTVCNVIRAEVAASAPETGAKAMPQRNPSRRLVLRLVLFTLAGWLLWALGKNSALPGAEPEIVTTAVEDGHKPTRASGFNRRGFSKRRLASTLAFTTLFFAGAAFSAGAGDLAADFLEGSCNAETTSTEGAPGESCDPAPPVNEPEAPPVNEPEAPTVNEPEAPTVNEPEAPTVNEPEAPTVNEPEAPTVNEPETETDPAPGAGSESGGDASGADDQGDEPEAGPGSPAHAGDESQSESDVGLTSEEDAPADLEFDSDTGYGVVWLHRELGDPTPPAKRLAPAFARQLVRASRASHVEWPLVLGVLRAQGHKSSRPASFRQLRSLASQLHALRANANEWRAVLALSGRTAFADRSVALANYNRAVRLRGLVRGLKAETPALEQRVLNDSRLGIYPGGRDDVAHHRINVRVLVLVLYMAEAHGSVTVSSLDSGHRLYSRPGVISAHKYGLAVDIAALGGESILGHQQVGGLTERAVRNILLLPVELRPKQVISLLGLGGPSFPLADHYDHIHVGY
jgi:outer membrane biosynthesis protein TonB